MFLQLFFPARRWKHLIMLFWSNKFIGPLSLIPIILVVRWTILSRTTRNIRMALFLDWELIIVPGPLFLNLFLNGILLTRFNERHVIGMDTPIFDDNPASTITHICLESQVYIYSVLTFVINCNWTTKTQAKFSPCIWFVKFYFWLRIRLLFLSSLCIRSFFLICISLKRCRLLQFKFSRLYQFLIN